MSKLDDFKALQAEVEAIGKLVASRTTSATALGSRIAKAVDRFEELTQTQTESLEPEPEPEPEGELLPDKVLAKRAGYPDHCEDCGSNPCACFSHLPRPRLTIRPDRKISIAFDGSWSNSDRLAWLQAAKMVLVKK